MKKTIKYSLCIFAAITILLVIDYQFFPAKYKIDKQPIKTILSESLTEKDTVFYDLDFAPVCTGIMVCESGLVFRAWYENVMYKQAILSCEDAAVDFDDISRTIRCEGDYIVPVFESGSVAVYYAEEDGTLLDKITSIHIPYNITKLEYRGFEE